MVIPTQNLSQEALAVFNNEELYNQCLEKVPDYNTRLFVENDVKDLDRCFAIFFLTLKSCKTIDEEIVNGRLCTIKEWTKLRIRGAMAHLIEFVIFKNSVITDEQSKKLLVITANRVKSILSQTFPADNQTSPQQLIRDVQDILAVYENNKLTGHWISTSQLIQKVVQLKALKYCLEMPGKEIKEFALVPAGIECIYQEMVAIAETKPIRTISFNGSDVMRNNIFSDSDNSPQMPTQNPSEKLKLNFDAFMEIVMDVGKFDATIIEKLFSIGARIGSPNPPSIDELRDCQDLAAILIGRLEKLNPHDRDLLICKNVSDSIDNICRI